MAAAAGESKATDRPLKLLSYNIRHAEGADDVLGLERIANIIRASGADVVALQEVDRYYSQRSGCLDQAQQLARILKMRYVYGANLDLAPGECPQSERQYGTAILSRYSILESRNTLLPRPEGGEQRGLLEALIQVRGVGVRVFNTHLQHNSQVERTAQVQVIMDRMAETDEPAVLMGDLNARPNAPELAPLYASLKDAWVEAGEGPGYTISSTNPYARIDYVFVSRDIGVTSAEVLDSAYVAAASDHLPVAAVGRR